jgi:hypothetical protein
VESFTLAIKLKDAKKFLMENPAESRAAAARGFYRQF